MVHDYERLHNEAWFGFEKNLASSGIPTTPHYDPLSPDLKLCVLAPQPCDHFKSDDNNVAVVAAVNNKLGLHCPFYINIDSFSATNSPTSNVD